VPLQHVLPAHRIGLLVKESLLEMPLAFSVSTNDARMMSTAAVTGRMVSSTARAQAMPTAATGPRLLLDRIVDLDEGREGFDFLGWHFRAWMSGRLLERGIRRYYLHRWPSVRAMKAIRVKIKARTGRHRVGVRDIKVIIAKVNPILRGWAGYFRTGNAAKKFNQIDTYVRERLLSLMIKQRGPNLRAGQVQVWTRDWFRDQGLYRLRGTIRYPKAA